MPTAIKRRKRIKETETFKLIEQLAVKGWHFELQNNLSQSEWTACFRKSKKYIKGGVDRYDFHCQRKFGISEVIDRAIIQAAKQALELEERQNAKR
jgi:hypothetical protein